jgi:hypothetical protein
MIGFLLHLVEPWKGMRHVMIFAVDVEDMLRQAYQNEILTRAGNSKLHRITAVFRTKEDWDRFARLSFCELCCECTKPLAA